MVSGRPSKFKLDIGDQDGPWREVLAIGEDDRLTLSADLLRRLPWLDKGSEIIAVLCSNGSMRWIPFDAAMGRIGAVLGSSQSVQQSEDRDRLLLAIQTRYVRLKISDQRLFIPNDIRLCLGLSPKAAAFVTLVIRGEEVLLRKAAIEDYELAEIELQERELP